jgi:transcriptional regulator GlxA family with amidase domain
MRAGRVCRDELLNSTAPTAPATLIVPMATEYIRTHLADDIDVDDVGRHLGDVSGRLVDRRFRELNGNYIRRTIEDLRLEKVKSRLTATNMSIEKISRLCGYASTQRLKYVFTSRLGNSMSE